MRIAGERNWPDEEVSEFIDPALLRRRGLPPPGRAAAGDHLHRRAGRARALALRQPAGRGDPRLQPRGMDRQDPGLWARLLHPDDRERALSQENSKTLGDRNPPPVDYRMITRERRGRLDPRRGGARARQIRASRSGTASSTTSPSARSPSRSCSARGPAGDGRPARRAGAAGRRPRGADGGGGLADRRDRRRRQRLHLGGRSRRPSPPPAGRPRGPVLGAGRRVSAARDSHAGAALESGLHVIVDDWSTEARFTMPPVAARASAPAAASRS